MLSVSLKERAADAEAEKDILQHEISAERDNNQNLKVCKIITMCVVINTIYMYRVKWLD